MHSQRLTDLKMWAHSITVATLKHKKIQNETHDLVQVNLQFGLDFYQHCDQAKLGVLYQKYNGTYKKEYTFISKGSIKIKQVSLELFC